MMFFIGQIYLYKDTKLYLVAKYLLINIVMKVVRLNEKDIEKLVNKIIKEDKSVNETGYKGGMTFGPFRDIVDSVTDRYRIYRDDYWKALDKFNESWPLDSTKVRNIKPGQ